ncbi:O-methyltransferase [Peribacillus sp. NPDC097264]|uniref:O-methyltransferase n=1 Tax=unclassified Peribacillus TaxID=2675266 RepID=UPI0038286E3D
MNGKIDQYLHDLLPERTGLIKELEDFAREHNVPIMEPEGIEVLLQILRLHQPKAILEVGAAIGYSAIRMAETLPDVRIVTLERNEARIEQAKANIAKSGLSERITLIEGDALEAGPHVKDHGPFDIIFVDAAKGQYKRFFELFEPFLNEAGIIITDNVLFKGLVAENIEEMEMTRRKRALIRKIKDFNIWLHDHPHYDTVILPIGDGVAISKHRGDKHEKA